MKDGKQKEKRVTEDEMVRCATAYEPGQTPGDGGEEGGLVCCSPWSLAAESHRHYSAKVWEEFG